MVVVQMVVTWMLEGIYSIKVWDLHFEVIELVAIFKVWQGNFYLSTQQLLAPILHHEFVCLMQPTCP